jgi:hypothetical protein
VSQKNQGPRAAEVKLITMLAKNEPCSELVPMAV